MIKNGKVMSLKDIEKLKERVDKDPNSKLFVPLAEEYRKEGLLDEAISVLTSGIERQPGYMSARVSLGKIFLEKGMTSEARSEFESVVKSIPDNLYAHKKLAEIYRDMGKKDMSIRSYRTVLKLNPLDDEALSSLRELEEEEELQAIGEAPGAAPETQAKAGAVFGKDVAETVPEAEAVPDEETPTVAPEAPAAIDIDDLTAFKDSLFGDKAVAEEAEILGEAADETIESGEEEALEIVEEVPAGDEEEMSFADIGEAIEEVPSPGVVTAEEKTGVGEEEIAGTGGESASGQIAGGQAKTEDADRFIAEGDYLQAMRIYRSILSSNPDNRMVLQRVEELKTLLKLLGKDKDALIAKLNSFLEDIRKGRDEFQGRS